MGWLMGIIGVVALWIFGIGIAKVTIWPLLKGIVVYFMRLYSPKEKVENWEVWVFFFSFGMFSFLFTPIGAIIIFAVLLGVVELISRSSK